MKSGIGAGSYRIFVAAVGIVGGLRSDVLCTRGGVGYDSGGDVLVVHVGIDTDGAFHTRARLTSSTGPRLDGHSKDTSHGRGHHGAGMRAGTTAHFTGKHANGQICLVFCPEGDTTVAVAHLCYVR